MKTPIIAFCLVALTIFTLSILLGTGDSQQRTHTLAFEGSWVHNPLECQNDIAPQNLFEMQFMTDSNNAVNGVNIKSKHFNLIPLSIFPKDHVSAINTALEHCPPHRLKVNELTLLAGYTANEKPLYFGLFQEQKLMVLLDGEKTYLLRPLSRIKELIHAQH